MLTVGSVMVSEAEKLVADWVEVDFVRLGLGYKTYVPFSIALAVCSEG